MKLTIKMSEKSVPEKQNLSELIEKYQNQLKYFIRKRVPTQEDAEDILQDVFYQLVKADNLMKPIEQVSAWLYRVARNHISNFRNKKRESVFSNYQTDDDEVIFDDFADILFSKNNSEFSTPESEYLRTLVWEELENALSELPSEQREIFEQTELLGFPVKEISKKTGISVSTLLSRKHYAVIHLRSRLKTLYYEVIYK